MLVKILKHGTGKSRGGTSAKDYLLGKDNDRVNARLLKGDPDITTEVINGLKFAKTYTSGGIHFAYDEAKDLTEQDKYDIIESFEKAMFPNLEPSQVSGYWVEHTDKVNEQGERRLELNFIYANVDLESGKALPVYYHANDVHLTSAWRDYTNIKYDLIDPLEIQRQQTIKIANNLPKHKKEILQDIHEIVTAKVVNGDIKNRSDIVETLENIDGIELLGKPLKNKYITIKDPDNNGKNIRLRGAIYDDPQWTIQEFIRELERAEEADTRPKSERLREAQARLQYSVGKREERFEKRFSEVARRSAERAERLEAESIERTYRHYFNDNESSRTARAESPTTRAERDSTASVDRRENRNTYKQRAVTAQNIEQQTSITSANAIKRTDDSNSSIERNNSNVISSNVDNAQLHRKAKAVLHMDIGLISSFDNNLFSNNLGDKQQATATAGKLSDEQDTRTNHYRESATATNAGTATSKRATDSIQERRTATLEQLTEELERTSTSVYDFAEQIRPSPFNRPVRSSKSKDDSDRQEDDDYQYTYDADRERESEQNERIESAFGQIDRSIEQATQLNAEIIDTTQEIEQRKIEAEKPKPQPEPTPPPSPSPSRGFRP